MAGNSFFALNTLLSSMEAQQTAIDVASHNIANASTPGYSRQSVDLQTTPPFYDPSLFPAGVGQIGTGVQVSSIYRSHNDFVQQQILYQNQAQNQEQTLSTTLSQISQLFNEPTGQGFGSLMSNFFSGWQQLANNPSDSPTRAALVTQANALTSGFNTIASSLVAMQQDQDKQVGSMVTQINSLTQQIASLNGQIVSVQAAGQTPNDLMDQRDNLLNQLSQIVNISYTTTPGGEVNVSLAGQGMLVQGVTKAQLATINDPSNPPFSAVVFQGQTTPLALSGGTLGGALQARDTVIAGRIAQLNSLATNLILAVNALQSTGYGSNGATGINFFSGTSASTIAVNPAIQNNLANIAAAQAPNLPGDGSQATAIAQLQENPPAGSTVTLPQQYQTIISQLGTDTQQAQQQVQNGALVLQNLTTQQSSVSGVSINEEASNLMQYQSAYNAAAKVISQLNQMISDMINSLG